MLSIVASCHNFRIIDLNFIVDDALHSKYLICHFNRLSGILFILSDSYRNLSSIISFSNDNNSNHDSILLTNDLYLFLQYMITVIHHENSKKRSFPSQGWHSASEIGACDTIARSHADGICGNLPQIKIEGYPMSTYICRTPQ